MKNFALFYRNFLACSFQNKLAYLLHFAVPPISFLAMYALLSLSESASFAGTQAIGMVLYFTMVQAALIVSLVLKDREQGIMARIMASPASQASYALGNGAAALTILAAQTLLFVSLVTFVFRSGSGLGFLELLPILATFDVACIGFAFFVCALSDSSSAAMILANMAVMFMSLLGGSFFPVEFMSPLMQKLAFAFPQYWVMRAIKQAQSGAPLLEGLLSLLILLLFALLFFVLQGAINGRKRRA